MAINLIAEVILALPAIVYFVLLDKHLHGKINILWFIPLFAYEGIVIAFTGFYPLTALWQGIALTILMLAAFYLGWADRIFFASLAVAFPSIFVFGIFALASLVALIDRRRRLALSQYAPQGHSRIFAYYIATGYLFASFLAIAWLLAFSLTTPGFIASCQQHGGTYNAISDTCTSGGLTLPSNFNITIPKGSPITTTNTILPTNTTPLHNTTITTTAVANTIPANTVSASAEPNTIPPAAVTTYLMIPINADPIKFSYIPIETTNTTQIAYLCKYMAYTYQNPLYQTGYIGKDFASIYTLRGQYEFADLGRVMADSDNTTPGWLTAYCN